MHVYLELVHKRSVAIIHDNESLRQMDAVIQRIPHQYRKRNSLYDAQRPAKHVEESTQSAQNCQNSDHHWQDQPEIMGEDDYHHGTKEEGDDDAIDGAIDCGCLYVHLHPVVTGLEGREDGFWSLIVLAWVGVGFDIVYLRRQELLPPLIVTLTGQWRVAYISGLSKKVYVCMWRRKTDNGLNKKGFRCCCCCFCCCCCCFVF